MARSSSKYGKRGHVVYYKEKMPTHTRVAKEIKKIANGCWWIEQYLRSSMMNRTKKPR